MAGTLHGDYDRHPCKTHGGYYRHTLGPDDDYYRHKLVRMTIITVIQLGDDYFFDDYFLPS